MKSMQSIFAGLIASFALTAAAGPFPPKPLPPPPPPDPREQQNLSDYYPSIQSAVSAYFNTLGVKGSQVRKGLVIPWVALTPVPYETVDLLGGAENQA